MENSSTELDKLMHTLLFSTVDGIENYTKYYTPKKGDTVVDAGAHVGLWTQNLSNMVGQSGRVIAIEPDYRALGLSLLNNEDRNNIEVLPCALWDTDTVIQFHVLTKTIGVSSCIFEYTKDNCEKYPIKAKTLKTIMSELDIDKIDFLKMDIEASEVRALHGMEDVFDKIDHLAIAAYHRVATNSEEHTCDYVVAVLEKYGYDIKVDMGLDGEIVYADRSL